MKLKLKINRENGFAMLFAVLTSSVLLSIGLSIYGLTIKEIALSSSGRDSQAAFYAADSGIECAFYWDVIGGVFATSSDSAPFPSSGVSCAGQNLAQGISVVKSSIPPSATTTLSFAPDTAALIDGVCTLVTISKHSESGIIKTEIQSRGYNVGYNPSGDTKDCSTVDDLKLERALKVNY